jgi:transcriptional regulator with XRE-family HTH domain
MELSMNLDAAAAAKNLGTSAGGEFVRDPLADWGFRFYPERREWRRAANFSRERLSRTANRSEVANCIGVSEDLLEAWEIAAVARLPAAESQSPEQLLSLGPDGPVNTDPLISWRLRYYPAANRWRRTRASRNEVLRAEVAEKVGVAEDIIERWELAIQKILSTESPSARLTRSDGVARYKPPG